MAHLKPCKTGETAAASGRPLRRTLLPGTQSLLLAKNSRRQKQTARAQQRKRQVPLTHFACVQHRRNYEKIMPLPCVNHRNPLLLLEMFAPLELENSITSTCYRRAAALRLLRKLSYLLKNPKRSLFSLDKVSLLAGRTRRARHAWRRGSRISHARRHRAA